MRLTGQVWTSIDEKGLQGMLKGFVMWSGNLRTSVGGALPTRARVAAEPLLEEQAALDSASAHDHDLMPGAAEKDNVAIPTAEVDVTASMDCSVQQAC